MTQPNPTPDILTDDAVSLLASVAAQLQDWAAKLNKPTQAELRGIQSGLLDVANDLQGKIEQRSPLECRAMPRIVAQDLAEAIRGCSEAGYFDDDVKSRLDDFGIELHGSDGVRRSPLLLMFTDEDVESTGGIQDLIRKAAGLPVE